MSRLGPLGLEMCLWQAHRSMLSQVVDKCAVTASFGFISSSSSALPWLCTHFCLTIQRVNAELFLMRTAIAFYFNSSRLLLWVKPRATDTTC